MPKAAHQVHDTFFKKLMHSKRFSVEFMKAHLPVDIRERCNLNKLELLNQSFISDDDRTLMADVVFRVQLNNQELAYITVLVEHQRKAEKIMPFRIMKYQVQVMDYHYRHCKRLPLVYPIVFYNGHKPYNYSLDIKTLVDAPSKLVERYFFKPAKLIDLSRPELHHSEKYELINLMQLCMSHQASCLEVACYLERVFCQLSEAELRSVLNYVAHTKIYTETEFDKIKAAGYMGGKMTTYFEKVLAEQHKIGRHEAHEEIIVRMLEKTKDYKKISEYTGATIAQIKQISEQHGKAGNS